LKKCRSLNGTRCEHPVKTGFGAKAGLNVANCEECEYFYPTTRRLEKK
jgi:hypothetical protein